MNRRINPLMLLLYLGVCLSVSVVTVAGFALQATARRLGREYARTGETMRGTLRLATATGELARATQELTDDRFPADLDRTWTPARDEVQSILDELTTVTASEEERARLAEVQQSLAGWTRGAEALTSSAPRDAGPVRHAELSGAIRLDEERLSTGVSRLGELAYQRLRRLDKEREESHVRSVIGLFVASLIAVGCAAALAMILARALKLLEGAADVRVAEAEARFRAAVNASQDAFFAFQARPGPSAPGARREFAIVDHNRLALELAGGAGRSLLSVTASQALSPPLHAALAPLLAQVWSTGAPIDDELEVRDAGGVRFLRCQIVPIPEGVAVTAHDVTPRRRMEEDLTRSLKEKVALLQEIHHRVKNNLQVISSLLNLQARTVPDERLRELFRESQGRVQSIALFHDKVYRSHDLASVGAVGYVKDLVANIYRSMSTDRKASYVVEGDDVHLDVDAAVPCGLIVNELVSNALKHAFPPPRGGQISVAIKRDGPGSVLLRVADDGVGLPEDIESRQQKTLGLQLVSTLTTQLRGTLSMSRSRGTTFEVRFPVADAGRS